MRVKELLNLLQMLENDEEITVEVKIKKVAKEAPKAQETKPQTKENAIQTQNSQSQAKPAYKSFKELPAGVKAEKRGNRYVAVETEKGALYKNKDILKNKFGFQWNATEKVWEKKLNK